MAEKILTAEEWLKDKLPFNAINVMEDDEVQNTVSIPHLLEDYFNYKHSELSKPTEDEKPIMFPDGKEEWDKAMLKRDADSLDLPQEIKDAVLKQYPIKPFYMRGASYAPIDLNADYREAAKFGYSLNGEVQKEALMYFYDSGRYDIINQNTDMDFEKHYTIFKQNKN